MRVVKATYVHLLLTAPGDDITLAMVQDFVSLAIPENLTVEYKLGGNKPIEAVAALANTYGGLILVGVGEEPRGVPNPDDIRGVSRSEKDRLVSQMATNFDPPWSPEVIEVPLPESGKVVLVIRIDRELVPAPIVLDGRILIRLDGRNVAASRQIMATLIAQAGPTQELVHFRREATRSPANHRSAVPPQQGVEQPDLHFRAVTSVPLPLGRRRHRMPTGMPAKLVAHLSRTQLHPLTKALSIQLQPGGGTIMIPWAVERATSREVVLALRSRGEAPEGTGDGRVLCRVVVSIHPTGSLDVLADVVLWQESHLLSWDYVQQAFLALVPAVGNVLLPEALAAIIGPVTLSLPMVEMHLSTHRYGEQDRPVEHLVDVSSLGYREDARPFYGAGEIIDESLIDNGDWAPAVIDALTTMAMDWGFPSPKLG
jgi:hypothetical protein